MYAVSPTELKVTTGNTVLKQEPMIEYRAGASITNDQRDSSFRGQLGFGLNVELDVVTVDLRHLHVRGVFLALGSGELAIEFDVRPPRPRLTGS